MDDEWWINEWLNDEFENEWLMIELLMNGMNELMNGWMNDWVNDWWGWLDRWMNGKLNEWINVRMSTFIPDVPPCWEEWMILPCFSSWRLRFLQASRWDEVPSVEPFSRLFSRPIWRRIVAWGRKRDNVYNWRLSIAATKKSVMNWKTTLLKNRGPAHATLIKNEWWCILRIWKSLYSFPLNFSIRVSYKSNHLITLKDDIHIVLYFFLLSFFRLMFQLFVLFLSPSQTHFLSNLPL